MLFMSLDILNKIRAKIFKTSISQKLFLCFWFDVFFLNYYFAGFWILRFILLMYFLYKQHGG